MSLTSQQKHYIKKNIKKLPFYQIASDLGLRQKQVEYFVKKQFGKDALEKLENKSYSYKNNMSSVNKDFSFSKFFHDNFHYFIILFLLVLVCYANSLQNQFVSDDIQAILKNPDIGNINTIFSPLTGSIQRLIYFIIFKLGGLTPGYFRLASILFHLGSVFLVFIILSLLTKKKHTAVFSSAIFAVHPILVESITWISGMPYSLYSFFFLLSFLFYILSSQNKKMIYASVSLFLLTILNSEKAIVLISIFFLYDLTFGSLRKNWKKYIPYFLVCFVFAVIYLSKIGQRIDALNTNYYQDASGLFNPLTQVPVAIASYLWLIVWPDKLTLYHTEMSFTPFQYSLTLILLIGLLGAIFYSWKKNKQIFFWLSFFFITLSPTLTPLKIAWVVAERYVYLGSIGIFVIFALFVSWLIEKNEEYKAVYYSLFIMIIIALGARTIVRNTDWKSEDTLWPATVKVSPSGAPIHNNMGDVYARHGDYQKAIQEFTRATQINPAYGDAYHNLANTYQQTGQMDKAIENYQKALSINPNIWQSYQNIASIYFDERKYDLAQESIQKALVINPNDPTLQNNAQMIQNQLQQNSAPAQ